MASRSRLRFLRSAKVLSAAVSTLLALFLCELGARWLGLAPHVIPIDLTSGESPFRRSENAILGYQLRESHRSGERWGHVQTNSIGQRDIERSLEKPSATLRTIVLGDSVVQGLGIANTDDTLTRQLELIYANPNVEFLNFGVDGYCTRSEVELLEMKGLALKPDRVIMIFVENDFYNFNPYVGKQLARRPQAINWLFRSSSVFRLACVQLNLFGFAVESDPLRWNKQAIGDNNVVGGLSRLSKLSKSHNFQTLIAIWPKFLDDAIVDVHPVPDSDELIIEHLARINGLPTVRLSNYFRKQWETSSDNSNPRLLYTNGDMMHPSVLGCRIAAESLKAVLDTPDAFVVQEETEDGVSERTRAAIHAARVLGTKQQPMSEFYYRQMLNKGVKASQSGKWAEAEQLYRKAMKLRPDLPNAYFNLGVFYESQGQIEDARNEYLNAIECETEHEMSNFNVAILYAREGKTDEAINYLRQATKINPQFTSAHFMLAVAYHEIGENASAVEQLNIVLEQQPDHKKATELLTRLR